jgi:hypothetical protein
MAHRHVRQLVRERGARLGGELVAFGPLDLLQEFGLDRVAGLLLALAQSLAIAPLLLGRGNGHGLACHGKLPASRSLNRGRGRALFFFAKWCPPRGERFFLADREGMPRLRGAQAHALVHGKS